jgi:hypothetical protein
MNNLANSGLRKSASTGNFKRMSYVNNDGTTTEIKKDTNMSGKEELLEITYDPQGNIITKKKADGGRSSVRFNFHEIQEVYDPFDNYNIYEGGSVYVQTIPSENIQIVTTTTNIPVSNLQVETEHNFGSTGYSLMDNNLNVKEWYFDVSKYIGIEDGVPYEDDLYLDVVLRPDGSTILLDEDELKEAFDRKEMTKEEYDEAYKIANDLIEKINGKADGMKKFTDKYLKFMLKEEG